MSLKLESAERGGNAGLVLKRVQDSEFYIIPKKIGESPIKIMVVECAGGIRLGIRASKDYLILRDEHLERFLARPEYSGLINSLYNSKPLTANMLSQLNDLRI